MIKTLLKNLQCLGDFYHDKKCGKSMVFRCFVIMVKIYDTNLQCLDVFIMIKSLEHNLQCLDGFYHDNNLWENLQCSDGFQHQKMLVYFYCD